MLELPTGFFVGTTAFSKTIFLTFWVLAGVTGGHSKRWVRTTLCLERLKSLEVWVWTFPYDLSTVLGNVKFTSTDRTRFGTNKLPIQDNREKIKGIFPTLLFQGKKASDFLDRKELGFLCSLSDLIQGQGSWPLNTDVAVEKAELKGQNQAASPPEHLAGLMLL